MNWTGFENYHTRTSVENKSVIVPIRPSQYPSEDKAMPVVPQNVFLRPCRVKIKMAFPIRPGFAITVDKAQGQTLDRVVVALSCREHQISNFTYACVYVAMSRVRESKRILLSIMS